MELLIHGQGPPKLNHSGQILETYSLFDQFEFPNYKNRSFGYFNQQHAANKVEVPDDVLYMSPDLCQAGADGLYDCFGLCNNTSMFSSTTKLHNCQTGMLLSVVNKTQGYQRIYAEPSVGEPSTSIQGVTDKIPIKAMSKDETQESSRLIVQCFSAAFHSLGKESSFTAAYFAPDPDQVINPAFLAEKEGNAYRSKLLAEYLCPLIPRQVDPDVGGIGVCIFILCDKNTRTLISRRFTFHYGCN